jgi:hypothetical protein
MIFYRSRQTIIFFQGDVRWIAQNQMESRDWGEAFKKIGLDKLNPLGYPVPGGIVPCDTKRGFRDIERPACGCRNLVGNGDRKAAGPSADVEEPGFRE